jgi:hypothetical protein
MQRAITGPRDADAARVYIVARVELVRHLLDGGKFSRYGGKSQQFSRVTLNGELKICFTGHVDALKDGATTANVRFGSIATISAHLPDVCLPPNSNQKADVPGRPKGANRRHAGRSPATSG